MDIFVGEIFKFYKLKESDCIEAFFGSKKKFINFKAFQNQLSKVIPKFFTISTGKIC